MEATFRPVQNFTQALNAPLANTPAYGECIPGCVSYYTVQSGDYCAKIASDHGEPLPLLEVSDMPHNMKQASDRP